jgi:glycosyltransferase involved in cell wall biosynthesis
VNRPPRIAFLTPWAVLPADRPERLRAHHLWRALAVHGTVVPVVLGDPVLRAARRPLRAVGAWLLPRRRAWAPQRQPASEEGQENLALPALWEVAEGSDWPDRIWQAMAMPEGLTRHSLNPRRLARIAARLRDQGADLLVLGDAALAPLIPVLRPPGVPVVVAPACHSSAAFLALARGAPGGFPGAWAETAAQAYAAAEQHLAREADQLWVASRADARSFAGLLPRARIRLLPEAHDVVTPTSPPDTAELLVLGAGEAPDEQRVQRLIAISRALEARGVPHRLRIAGPASARSVAALRGVPAAEVLDDAVPLASRLQAAALVLVVPSAGADGRRALLQAMGAGRPALALAQATGLEAVTHEVHAVLEPELDAFPARIAELLQDPARRGRIAAQGWALVRDRHAPAALQEAVGDALKDLGLHPAASRGGVFAANLGLALRDEQVRFNRHSRLLTWSFTLLLPAGADDVTVEVVAGGMPDLPNAFVTVRGRPYGVGIDLVAVLPPALAPEQLILRVSAWGQEVLRRPLPPEVPVETAGLMTLEEDSEGVAVLAWTDAPRTRLAPAAVVSLQRPAGPGPAILRARLEQVQDAASLAVLPDGGLGQTLPHPARWLLPHPASSARLQAMRDCHKGETAWLIGNGPSVRADDLDALQGRLCFAFNRFHLAYPATRLRPDYTVSGDRQMIEDFGQRIVDESAGTVFLAQDQPPDLVGDYVWLRQIGMHPPLFSRRPDRVVSPGGSSLYVAMQLGFWMGVRRFYLYGADFRFVFARTGEADAFRGATGEGNHFIPDYRGGRAWCPPSLRDIGNSFHIARRLMEAEGGFVRSASRGGLMEIFPREAFEAALAAG